MRKIVSFLLIAVFLIVPVSAASSSNTDVEYIQKSSFWTWAAGKGKPLNGIIGNTFGAVCPNSEDGYHHASSYERPIGNWTVESGYYKCICDLCGAEFKAYEKDLQQSYEAQVEELPASIYGADGSIYVIPEFIFYHLDSSSISYLGGNGAVKESDFFRASVNLPLIRYEFLKRLYDTSSSCRCGIQMEYTMPFFGTAELLYSSASYAIIGKNGAMSLSSSHGGNYSGGIKSYEQGSVFRTLFVSDSFEFIRDGNYILSGNYINFYLNDLRLKLTPYDTGTTTDNIYNINSRPTSITGDYGIIGDNGQIIKVEGDKIVNETNNTYYNPATGETTTITDWSYNYEDRSYTVTTESGDTVTITYGDENVTIQEGDTIYNVYYLVNGSGSEGPGPDVPPACNHQWTETSTTPATCTVPGFRLLTCSLCNETKTETIPAPGHKWTIKQEVKNEYDENGNQTQEGYIIWECSVCGEQQKTTDGTAPPGGGSGTGSGSSGGVFSGIFGLLVDFLGFFWNTFRDFVGEGVKGFLNALMDGTSSIFGLLNPFNWGG